MATAPSINGTSYSVGITNVKIDTMQIGVEIRAANGARRFAQRAIKREISVEFQQISVTLLNQLRTVAALATSFTFIDENAVSYTVICSDKPLSQGAGAILNDGSVEYDCTLTLWEV